jgi:hypothetical protein
LKGARSLVVKLAGLANHWACFVKFNVSGLSMSMTVERLTSSIARAEYSTGEWANSRNRPRLTIGAPSTAALAIAARFSNARLLSLSLALDVEVDLFMVAGNTLT